MPLKILTPCLCLFFLAACGVPSISARDPGHAVTNRVAEIMVQGRVYDTATPLLRQGIAADPNNGHLHMLMAQVLRDRGIYEQALAEYQLARKLSPHEADIAAGLAVLYDLRNMPDAAEIWHREALGLDSGRGDLYNNLGFSLHLHGDYYGALAAYQESLRRNPNQQRVYNNLGFTYARLHDMGAALAAFKQGGSRAQAQANMGLAYELSGELTEARQSYKTALRLDRNLDVARHNLRNLDDLTREKEKSTTMMAD